MHQDQYLLHTVCARGLPAAKPSLEYDEDYMNELIIYILNPLVVSRMQKWRDYLNIEPTSFSKTATNWFAEY